MSSHGSMTVQDALALPSLRSGGPRVAAGAGWLGRPIRWAHSGEVNNIATLLKGGELLLTTGMGIGRTAVEQRRFIRTLAERDVAGIVIELGQVFAQLPGPLVEAAAEFGIPLIELHREVPFVDVTEQIHSHIVGRQLAVVRRGDELHRTFTDLLLDGARISEILMELAGAIANPVILSKAGRGILYHATHRAPAAAVLARYELLAAADGEELDTADAIVRTVPAAGHRAWGSLTVLSLDSPIDDFDAVALERAVPLVALALLRGHQEATLVSQQRGNFLADVALGRLSRSDAIVRARSLGFTHSRGPLMAVAVMPTGTGPATGPDLDFGDDDWMPVWNMLRGEFKSSGTPAIVGARVAEGRTLVLLGLRGAGERINAVERLVDILEEATRRQLGDVRGPVVVAGPALASWDELPASLRQVTDLATSARSAPPRRWYDAVTPDLHFLLWRLSEDSRVTDFSRQVLAPIVDHDREHAHKLLPTLLALSENGWNMTRASEALFLNRRSLYPRLTRLERLLNCELGDIEARLAIDLALRTQDTRRT